MRKRTVLNLCHHDTHIHSFLIDISNSYPAMSAQQLTTYDRHFNDIQCAFNAKIFIKADGKNVESKPSLPPKSKYSSQYCIQIQLHLD